MATLLGNILLGWRKMRAKSYLDKWQSQTIYGNGSKLEILKNYELLPMHIDLYWTIRENRARGAKRKLQPVDVYHRCTYKDYKKVIKKVEADEWPQAIAMFEIELEKLLAKR